MRKIYNGIMLKMVNKVVHVPVDNVNKSILVVIIIYIIYYQSRFICFLGITYPSYAQAREMA